MIYSSIHLHFILVVTYRFVINVIIIVTIFVTSILFLYKSAKYVDTIKIHCTFPLFGLKIIIKSKNKSKEKKNKINKDVSFLSQNLFIFHMKIGRPAAAECQCVFLFTPRTINLNYFTNNI